MIVDLIDDLLLKFTENYNKYKRNEWSLLRPTLKIEKKTFFNLIGDQFEDQA